MTLRERLTSGTRLKLVAFFAALVVWLSLAGQPLTEASFDAPVHFSNVPENMELNATQNEHVTVILRGIDMQLRNLRANGVAVQVDFADVYEPGEKTLNVAEMNLGLPEGVHLVKSVPSQLRFALEPQLRREVAIQPQFVGSFEKEYSLASVKLDPSTLVVLGPESRVSRVDTVSTDPIDLSEVVGSRSFRVTAYLPDPYIRFDRDPAVIVEVQMRKRE